MRRHKFDKLRALYGRTESKRGKSETEQAMSDEEWEREIAALIRWCQKLDKEAHTPRQGKALIIAWRRPKVKSHRRLTMTRNGNIWNYV